MNTHIEPTILMNQPVSGSTPVLSNFLDCRMQIAGGFYISYTAGLNATFMMQYSVDKVHYADSGVIIPAATGTAGTAMLNVFGIGVPFLRFQVTPTSGSGTVTIIGSTKG